MAEPPSPTILTTSYFSAIVVPTMPSVSVAAMPSAPRLRAAEADAVAALGRRVFVAEGRAHPRRVRRVPRAAADHAARAAGRAVRIDQRLLRVVAVVVLDPLPDV